MRFSVTGLLCLVCLPIHANVIQYFAGISYSNPAELFTVGKNEFILGGTGFYTVARFEGSVLNFNTGKQGYGTAYSKTSTLLP